MHRTSLRPTPDPEHSVRQHPGVRRSGCGSGTFFGLDEQALSPRAQVVAALAVLVPVVLSGVFLLAVVPALWWVLTTYGWIAFPASSLLVRGLTGMAAEPSGKQKSLATSGAQEKELLGALSAGGGLSPAEVALQTSLSVAEADRMLKELAGEGHLEVRVRGGGIYYALWKRETRREEAT